MKKDENKVKNLWIDYEKNKMQNNLDVISFDEVKIRLDKEFDQ